MCYIYIYLYLRVCECGCVRATYQSRCQIFRDCDGAAAIEEHVAGGLGHLAERDGDDGVQALDVDVRGERERLPSEAAGQDGLYETCMDSRHRKLESRG